MYKQITAFGLGLMMMGSIAAQADQLTVKESDIANKTDLVAVADVDLNGKPATILTDSAGFSLYTFALDSKDKSVCKGDCLVEWPPQHVPSGKEVLAPFGVIQGNDGQQQLTLHGWPLYHYHDDEKPGDAFGQYPKWDAILVVK